MTYRIRRLGESPMAIDQQTVIAIITYILTRLFLEQQFEQLSLSNANTTQTSKHKKK
jgi:hypothetical protein